MSKWIKKYEDWRLKTLNYDFKRIFVLASVIYFICTFYDMSLTYITYRVSPDNFFKNEVSFAIKEVLNGNVLFLLLGVLIIISPLVVTYIINKYREKQYNMSINEIKICLFAVYFISGLHIVGGLTNFVYLINLRV